MKIEKVENFVANLHKKTEYVIHVRNLKEALDHRFVEIEILKQQKEEGII